MVPELVQLEFIDSLLSLALIVPRSRQFSISESRGSEARKYSTETVQVRLAVRAGAPAHGPSPARRLTVDP